MKLFLILALCSITIITVHAVVFAICDKCRLDLKTIVCTYLDSRYDNDENLSASMTQQDEDLKIEYTNKGIAFKNLSFSVRTRKKRELRILNEVTGWFNLGTSTALMGPSGSGKSTLLDILSMRKNSGRARGEMKVVGREETGYVEQFDTLVGELTVENMLRYTSELLCCDITKEQRISRVDEIISRLDLEKVRYNVIGTVLKRGISGGEAKRVNIGIALIPSPKVLFLDEPTTGLDSSMANEVCVMLQEIARSGRAVVAILHNPTALGFSLFDQLMMLDSNGQTTYFGPQHKMVDYMEHIGYHFPRDVRFNFVEWLVETMSGGGSAALRAARSEQGMADESQESEEKQEAPGADFAALWSQNASSFAPDPGGVFEEESTSLSTPQESKNNHAGFVKAIRVLFWFRTTSNYKSPSFVFPRLLDKVLFALLIMSLFWNIGNYSDPQSLQSTAAMLYFVVAVCGFGAAAVVPSLTLERPLFIRERNDGCFNPTTYWFFKLFQEAILAVFTSIIFSNILFWATGLSGSFWLFLLVFYASLMTGVALAYTFAALVPTLDAANALLPIYVATCLYFGGFIITYDKIPDGWEWYSYTVFLRYAWTALMVNEFENRDPMTLKFYSIEDENEWDNFGWVCLIFAIVAVIGGLAVQYLDFSQR